MLLGAAETHLDLGGDHHIITRSSRTISGLGKERERAYAICVFIYQSESCIVKQTQPL